MSKYQVQLSCSDGRLVRCRAFRCDTDEHAIEWAKQLMEGGPVELWSGARMVKRLSPTDDRQAITYGSKKAARFRGAQ